MGLHRIEFEELRSLAVGSMLTTFVAVGDPLVNPAYKLEITNATDEPIMVSFNGTTDNKFIPASTAVIYDYTMDSTDGDYLEKGKTVYARYIAGGVPSTGSVYVAVTYRHNRD